MKDLNDLLDFDREIRRLKNELHSMQLNFDILDRMVSRRDRKIEKLNEEIETLRARKPGTLAGEKVYPTLQMRDHRGDGGPFVAENAYLTLPDGSVLSFAEGSSIVLSADAASPLTASVELLIDGIEMGREA